MRCRGFLYTLFEDFIRERKESVPIPKVEYEWAWVDMEPLGDALNELMKARGDQLLVDFGRYVYRNIRKFLADNGWFVGPASILSLPQRIWFSCFDQGRVEHRKTSTGYAIDITDVVLTDAFRLVLMGWFGEMGRDWGFPRVSLREEPGRATFLLE